MTSYAALDVSRDHRDLCCRREWPNVAEKIVATCPDTIATWLLTTNSSLVSAWDRSLSRLALDELREHDLPVICLDARHAHAALKMRSNKTDRNDAAGLAQIVRTGWFKQVQIKSRDSYEIRSLLSGREVLVRIRVKIENEIRGLLRTFGVLFGKTAGGFARRARRLWRATWMPLPPCSS